MSDTTENSRRVLELLSQGKVTVDEAEQLLRALDGADRGPEERTAAAAEPEPQPAARWMRITIDRAAGDGRPPKQVTVRVPMPFVKSGIRLGAMLRAHGIDLEGTAFDYADMDQLLGSLRDTTIDVDGRKTVRISYE